MAETHVTVHRQLAVDILCGVAERVVELASAADDSVAAVAMDEAFAGVQEQQRQVL